MTAPQPEALQIRPEEPRDHCSVLGIVSKAFERHGADVADLVEDLARAGHLRLSLVGVLGDEVVGHVQLNHSWLDARERLVDVLVLSPLSVDPAHQRQGIGSALVAAAIAGAAEAGVPALFLEGGPDYYGARGFRRGSAVGFERPSTRIPDAAFQVVVLEAHEPWMTGRLVYCDPFWARDCVGLRDPVLAELEERIG